MTPEQISILEVIKHLVDKHKVLAPLAEQVAAQAQGKPAELTDIAARALRRHQFASSYYAHKLKLLDEWCHLDTENDNYYYRLTPHNMDQLTHLVSMVLGRPYDEITRYIDELETDTALREHIRSGIASAHYGRDIRVNFARRVGWYAFVRALKPRVVIETGVSHGVGSCVLTSALARNDAEGHRGRYVGTELDPSAGKLLTGRYAEYGQILYGDSLTTLRGFSEPIDLFINDSDHSAEYEMQEYRVVRAKLSPRGIILGDNSHASQSLSTFSREVGRHYVFFGEQPLDHWYPGAGIGISFVGSPGHPSALA